MTYAYQDRTRCPTCRHYHTTAMGRRCECCAETEQSPAPPPKLLPHIWVQPTAVGPHVYAGQIVTTDGKPARLKADGNFRPVPIRLQPLNPAGLHHLAELLQADMTRVHQGVAW